MPIMIPGDDHSLHSAANHVHPIGIECLQCQRRALLPVERIGAYRGASKLVKDLKLKCAVCGSYEFKSWLFFRPQQAEAFAAGLPYAEVWEMRTAGLPATAPEIFYWRDLKNPFRESAPASEDAT